MDQELQCVKDAFITFTEKVVEMLGDQKVKFIWRRFLGNALNPKVSGLQLYNEAMKMDFSAITSSVYSPKLNATTSQPDFKLSANYEDSNMIHSQRNSMKVKQQLHPSPQPISLKKYQFPHQTFLDYSNKALNNFKTNSKIITTIQSKTLENAQSRIMSKEDQQRYVMEQQRQYALKSAADGVSDLKKHSIYADRSKLSNLLNRSIDTQSKNISQYKTESQSKTKTVFEGSPQESKIELPQNYSVTNSPHLQKRIQKSPQIAVSPRTAQSPIYVGYIDSKTQNPENIMSRVDDIISQLNNKPKMLDPRKSRIYLQ